MAKIASISKQPSEEIHSLPSKKCQLSCAKKKETVAVHINCGHNYIISTESLPFLGCRYNICFILSWDS